MSEENADNANDAPAETDTTKQTTILDSTNDENQAIPADWPSDWRNKMAGEDEKTLARLGRFNAPTDLFKSYRAMEQKLSSGEVKSKLADDATPEQIAEYRKDAGIPETAAGYFENMPDGLVIGEDDKEIFNSVAETMHGINASPEVMHSIAKWYNDFQTQSAEAQYEMDTNYQKSSEDELRAEWGPEYRSNINGINAFLTNSFGDEASKALMGARLEDGTLLGNNPAILNSFALMGKALNPAATLVPNAGANAGSAIADEIATLKDMMGDQNSAYWKGASAEKNQARYRQLLDAQERMK